MAVAVLAVERAPARERPPLTQALVDLCGDDDREARLVHLAVVPARPARTALLSRPLPPRVAERAPGALWAHQALAIDLLRAGRSVVIATGTASGKSLCYQLPVAEAASAPVRPGTALALFPTKALAHDQLRALSALDLPGVVAGTYDGDGGPEQRTWVRRNANVVLTNPEMLHAGLLPNHERWATFLGRLRYVVVDELHAFRGVFGTHVAHVLRRLRRLAAHHGSDPVFVFCSATIGAPGRLARDLCGLEVTEVLDDGSPYGARAVAVLQPPLLDREQGRRGSAHVETARVVAGLVRAGYRTLGFCAGRRGTEVVAAEARRRLPRALARRVEPYRGGYLAEERRQIEQALGSGALHGVVATSALELGIDVGGLDAVVLDGFPGTIASFRQRAGRAGRARQQSAVVLVAGADQLDQWLATHPEQLLARPPEPAVINPANPHVLDAHLRCAAHELPLTHQDERYWAGLLDDGVRRLVLADNLVVRHRHWSGRRSPLAAFAGPGRPAQEVSLRCAAGPPVRIVDGAGRVIGDVDRARAPAQVHPGAVYLHRGAHHRVVDLDLGEGVAVVEPHDGSIATSARTEMSLELLGTDAQRPLGAAMLRLGAVQVTSRVVGYQVTDVRTGQVLGREPLQLPAEVLRTRGITCVVPDAVLDEAGFQPAAAPAALHAAEHAAIGMLPLFAVCDRWDVGGVSTRCHPDVGAATITVYDAAPGGAGIAELGFDVADRLLRAALDLIESCPCRAGCPSCVQSPKCGNGNEHLDKAAAALLLRAVLL